MDHPDHPETLHATTVAVDGRGIVIVGVSGAGKSALALQLIALGATLVADDRTMLIRRNGAVIATVPSSIQGKIEARGVGILSAPFAGPTPIAVIVDLDREETDRLPHPHTYSLCGLPFPSLWRPEGSHFPAAILLWLNSKLSHAS